jgi:hypothetical protein
MMGCGGVSFKRRHKWKTGIHCRALEIPVRTADDRFEEHGEIDELGATVLRRSRYTPEQILGDWFPPEPQP